MDRMRKQKRTTFEKSSLKQSKKLPAHAFSNFFWKILTVFQRSGKSIARSTSGGRSTTRMWTPLVHLVLRVTILSSSDSLLGTREKGLGNANLPSSTMKSVLRIVRQLSCLHRSLWLHNQRFCFLRFCVLKNLAPSPRFSIIYFIFLLRTFLPDFATINLCG